MKTLLAQSSHVSYAYFNHLKMKIESVVVVDDSIVDNFISKKVFELHGCRNIKIFSYYTQALKYLESVNESPDLIIVNIDMPYNSGFDFIEELKLKNLIKNKTNLLATSSTGLLSTYQEAVERNLKFVEKPITYNTIAEIVYSKN